jgi:hypothetical protein
MNPVSLLTIGAVAGAGTSVARAATTIAGGFGNRLRTALGGTEASAATERPDEPTIGDRAASAVRELQAAIRGLLAREGIELDQPLVVTQDQFDRVRVVGNHPQKQAIEALLGVEPELGDALRRLAESLLDAQSAGHATPRSPTAYERDGKATLELVVPPRTVPAP